jgi:hypothetical protein
VLAGISVVALETQHPTGPATVVRVLDDPQMADGVARLVRRLGVSGFWGADFVLDAAGGDAYLIEMNPRATPISHLALGGQPMLPAALLAQLGEGGCEPAAPPAGPEVIALFPGEWRRQPGSPYLHAAHHDVPWTEPALVLDGLGRPWAERGLLARLRERVHPRASFAAVDPGR